MREWSLKPGDPLVLTLAADARLGGTEYANDQIWELCLGGGEPPAMALQTTFGLRARTLRLFPRFTEGEETRFDPSSFDRPPVVTCFYPNFLSLSCAPFEDIDVIEEVWVPNSQSLSGRLEVINRGPETRQIRLEWAALLTPTEGQRMAAEKMAAAPVLAGSTGGLAPVVFMTGGPESGAGPYPSLALDLELGPKISRQITWSQAACATAEESFSMARAIAARNWDAERARIELLNAGQIEIYTGDPDWDAAFAMSQKLAFAAFLGPTPALPAPSFVLTRQPDQGHSLRGDGSDYNHLWNGQSPLEALHLAGMLLPSAPELAAGLLRNFLAFQEQDGAVDWRPGLAGQRSLLLATPVLATLAWQIYTATEDPTFLAAVFPPLLKFVQAWFGPEHDRDGDGIPEWDHPAQAGSDDHPLFSRWGRWSQGVDIATAESPSLCAFLYRECLTLIEMAGKLDREDALPALQSLAEHLRMAVETSWSEELACYQHWDRDTHFTPPGEFLAERLGPGIIPVERNFSPPARLLARVEIQGESTRRPQIFVSGASVSGQARVERLADNRFRWQFSGVGGLTGERAYGAIEAVEIQGLDPQDRISLYTVGYQAADISLLLPLWAGIPASERAAALIEKTVTAPGKFWQAYGLPGCLCIPAEELSPSCSQVQPLWNELVGEGLLRYGYRNEAAQLVTRLMGAVVQTLKREGAFRSTYGAETGAGSGERNSLAGLAPFKLFLDALGLRMISPYKVELQGFNPFPWPVTVKYRGMTVLRQKDKTMVIFPDGQTAVVNRPEACIVALE